jgi:hypothetical protein
MCALADSERHLGYAFRAGRYWLAYHAIHSNHADNGFYLVGTFRTLSDARQAIERSVGVLSPGSGIDGSLPGSRGSCSARLRE